MVYLTAHNKRLVTAHEVAETLSVSEAHLAKVLQRLARTGLVESVRGPKGGFALARAGEEISLLQVYEAIEGPLEDTHCLLGEPVCRGDRCILGGLLETVNRQAREYLAGTTLNELTAVYGEVVT
jgi:Rrf2 family protein